MAERIRFIVSDAYNGSKAGRYLRTVCKLSARTLALLKRTEGGLTVNGKLLRSIDTVYAGDVIEMCLPAEQSDIEPIEGELDILYEDAYILIVNKPAHMPVHPVKKHQLDTLANIVAHRYLAENSDFVFRAVNRLDSDTSGAVIIARDRHTASLMQTADVTKHYIAVCQGKPGEKGTVNAPIALRSDSKIIRTVTPDGQIAVTHYKLIQNLSEGAVLDVVLETGRTHQIRCHMAHIGHPLFGDDLYGGSREYISRQALHCRSVSFVHPFTSELIEAVAPMPVDIQQLIDMMTVGDELENC